MKKNILIVSIIIIAAASIAFFFLNSKTSVETVKTVTGEIVTVVEETGYVRTEEEATEVQSQNPGRIVKVNKRVGDKVRQGEELFVIENLDIGNLNMQNLNSEGLNAESQLLAVDQQLMQSMSEAESSKVNLNILQSDFEEFKKDFNRKKELFEANAISKVDYEAALNMMNKQENSVAALKIKINNLQSQIESLSKQKEVLYNQIATIEKKKEVVRQKIQQLTVVSPIEGEILTLPVKKEQMVTQGTILATIGKTDTLVVKVDLLSDDMADIKVGQEVQIKGTVLKGKPIMGRIKQIYPEAFLKVSDLGVSERRITIIVAFDKDDVLRPGYEVEVAIQTNKKNNVLLLPREALIKPDDKNENQVKAIVNNKIVIRDIKTGLKNKLYIEVTDGIKEGEVIIRDGTSKIRPGTKVKPKKE